MNENQKSAIEEAAKLPTAEETLYTYHPIGRDDELSTDLWPDDTVLMAMNEHTAAHTAALRDQIADLERENNNYRLVYDSVVKNRDELRERVKELEFGAQVDNDCIESQSNEIDQLKAWKQSAMAEAEKLDIQSIGMEIGCKLGSSIPEQVLPWIREQKAKIASYESAIDGLKKVVDSLYNLKS